MQYDPDPATLDHAESGETGTALGTGSGVGRVAVFDEDDELEPTIVRGRE